MPKTTPILEQQFTGLFDCESAWGTIRQTLLGNCINENSGKQLHYFTCNGINGAVGINKKILNYLENLSAKVVCTEYHVTGIALAQVWIWPEGCAHLVCHGGSDDDDFDDFDDEVFEDEDEDADDAQEAEEAKPDPHAYERVLINFCSLDPNNIKDIAAIFEANPMPKQPLVQNRHPGHAYVMADLPMQGISLVPLGLAGEKLVRDNYTAEVLKGFDRAVADIDSVTPHGRLIILEGVPGSGKSHMVQAFMNACPNSKFVVVPPSLLKSLEDPGFILTYMRQVSHHPAAAPLILVLEDADQCLSERKVDNMASISAILNLSDGIVGKLLNLRILATSNTPLGGSAFDKAILRKGRLSAHIRINLVSVDQANAIYVRLTADLVQTQELKPLRFTEPQTLAEIYDAALTFRNQS